MLITSWLRSVQTRLILNRRRSMRRRPERDAQARSAERLEDKTLLVAPSLVAVLPNVGEFLSPNEIRDIAPQQITLQFNPGQQIDPATLGAITVTRSVDGTFGNGDDVDVSIGYVGLGDLPEDVVVRFAENLPDDKYEINIDGTVGTGLANTAGEFLNDGQDESFPFELDLGAQIVSVVPQPISRRPDGTLRQDRNKIVVYFNDDDLDAGLATDPAFYDLIFTNDTTTNQDDVTFNPASVVYDSVADTATLTFSVNLHNLNGAGTYRLRVGTDEGTPPVPVETVVAADPGDAFRDADTTIGDLSAAGNTSQFLSAAIDPVPYDLMWPGANSEPGHREIEQESHLHTGADQRDGVSTIFYNFQDDYGFDPNGNQLQNLITDAQEQRAREVFELYSTYAGLDFVETDNLGFTIVTGDLRALDPTIPTGPGGVIGLAGGGIAIMDAAETWNDERGGNYFQTAMHEIGHLLGLGHSYDLPAVTVQGSEPLAGRGGAEPDYPGDHDIVHVRHAYRPDSNDIDLYEFDVTDGGTFTAEIIAERRANATNLDSTLQLFGEDSDGDLVLIAQNDDYYSDDSYLELELQPGKYYIGVSASGNDDYDPTIAGTGIGGTSQGEYDLRLNFRPSADDTLNDATGTAFDGDRDGVAGGVENFWFRAVHPDDQLVVDKTASAGGDGRNSAPFNQIDVALANAGPGDLVRIVGNGGTDGDVSTIDDNFAYEVGVDQALIPQPLVDGARMDIPRGVTTVIDAGAMVKFHRARIGVGSPTASVDNSGAALQILGIPGTDVELTSWLDETVGNDTTPAPTVASAGNWGGLMFQNNIDDEESRFNYENEGIFLNYVSHADIQYGGGSVVVNSTSITVNPIHMTEARPTVINNKISLSADSAMSADPDSFEETNFNSPRFQGSSLFTSDYGRVGPDVYGNFLVDNSTNGLFVRVETRPGSPPNQMTVSGRFDDTDIVHVFTGNLEIAGTPGGAVLDLTAPSVVLVTLTELPATGTLTAGVYNYRMVFVDSAGNESPASNLTRDVTVSGGSSSVRLENLPPAPAGFVGRRLYRSDAAAGGDYQLIANLDISDTIFVDDGTNLTGILVPAMSTQRARLNARLAIDAGTIVKLDQANFELGMGADLIAEGELGREIILTSRRDDRFGIGGTFDTNNDDDDVLEVAPAAGNWGGVYAGYQSSVSIDRALVTFGGGITPLEGDFATFNVLEIHQASARVTNTVFENNADGTGGTAPANRFGRLPNAAGTIFVRAAQPILVDNIIRDGAGPAITINTNSLNNEFVRDWGRARGLADQIVTFADNQGPLVRGNVLGRNSINGMEVRGETVTTGVVWDDAEIVHVLRSEIYIPDLHTHGGLRLESSSDASLVVKLEGASAGFTANGRPLDITDRIGGSLHIVGQPFRPVVLTSLSDDSIGAGFGLDGLPLSDTNSDGAASTPAPGDWRSVRIDEFANDRNVDIVVENETSNELSPDTNGDKDVAEFLGELGEHEKDSDDNLRLGFKVNGAISRAEDVDVYSFMATNGTEIWVDLDQTRHALDGVVELLDANGQILAQSDNSYDELRGTFSVVSGVGSPNVHVLTKSVHQGVDYYSTNQRDAGFRVVLPGTVGSVGTFFVRVRSSNIDSLDPSADRADLQDVSKLGDGLTFGGYELQVRLRETDEVPGSTVRYGDIRFAGTGIEVFGHPAHSPLAGELAETANNNNNPGSAQAAGNIGNSDRATLAFSGTLSADDDLDFFEFDVITDSIQTIANVTNPTQHVPVTIDLDYADGFSRANTIVSVFNESGALVYMGRDSNIGEDRAAPLNGSDVDDLSRGTIGPADAYIGPIELAVGKYFLAVSSNTQVPAVLDQYFSKAPNNTATRLEPINTVIRIADEQFGNELTTTAAGPITDLFTTVTRPDGSIGLAPEHTEFHLSDVSLYVSAGGITGGATGIYMVDGFTGDLQEHVGQFAQRIGDIAMRPDGELYTYANSTFGGLLPNDANLGHYAHITTDNGTITDIGDDGPTTWSAGSCLPPPATGVTQANVGINYSALHYTGTAANSGLAIGRNVAASGNAWTSYFEDNALYNFNIVSGATINQQVLPRIGDARACDGAHTNLYEIGEVNTVPNGIIQGLADGDDNHRVYGIDQFGNLYGIDYTLNTEGGRSVSTTTIRQVIDRPFTGLVDGPGVGTENGAYEDMLFGITANGDIYAFDTSGILQPVLAGGNFVVSTGINNPTGIAFGTLDYNLWDVTDNRGGDAGHGTSAGTPDGSRPVTDGETSLYFGNQVGAADAGNKNNLSATVKRDIDFPGGAQGEVVSNEFSLHGYSAEDNPTLYFNYFIETEDTDGEDISDSLRVYVGGDETFVDSTTGAMTPWSLLATNNETYLADLPNDEFDYGVGPDVTDFPDTQPAPNVQPIFDNSNAWRQVRVDLSDFAGKESLRLRFVFASSGTLNLGQVATQDAATFPASGGEEIYAIPGKDLRDGDQFTLTDGAPVTFTFDLGYTLITPSGGSITEGDTFVVNGTIFEFDSDGTTTTGFAVPYSPSSTASELARNVSEAIVQFTAGTVLVTTNGNRVNLSDAITLSQVGALTIEGAPGGGTNRIPVHSGMTRNEVADQIRLAMANLLTGGSLEAIQGTNHHIPLKAFSIVDPGPLPAGNMLPGDEFGFADSPIAGASTRGSNNAVEGVYIDDIIIGFAERGEMVTGAPNNVGFIDNFDVTNPAVGSPPDILVGPYDVEIRRASEHGFSQDDDPSLILTRTIDTNDRVASQTSLTIPNAAEVADGETFSLSDGTNVVIFEFNDSSAGNGVQPGHQPISFNPFNGPIGDEAADPDHVLAARVRDAINSPAVQGILDVVAGLGDGRTTASTSNVVNLYGNVVVDLEKPVDTVGILGELNPVAALNSDSLFTFENHSSVGETVSSISLTLPEGLYFDPNPGSGAPNDSGPDGSSGPDVSPGSDTVGQTFTFGLNNLGVRDTVDILFSNFDTDEVFEFGVDIEGTDNPFNYIGTRYTVTFDSGRSVAGFFRNTQDANPDAHDDVIDPERREFVAVLGGSLVLTEFGDYGDSNQFRDQGQILIQQNSITDSAGFGIVAQAGNRSPSNIPLGGTLPHQGTVRNLQELNTANLVHGIVIENNVVARGGTGGIHFAGDASGGVAGPIPHGRIVNNTVASLSGGVGILVNNNAGPTVLNNVLSGFDTGIEVAPNSRPTTVLGTTLYRGNITDANTGALGLGTFSIVLGLTDPLFIDEANGNYYPAPQSLTIDSSLDQLGDRTDLTRVKSPLGISVSPILAPTRDVFGQFRGDDPLAPVSGLGAGVFKDRGAIDRVDFFQPIAVLANPEDNGVNDLDPDDDEIWIDVPDVLRDFVVRLDDEGIGIDDSSVTSAAFKLFQDDVELIDGVDYLFSYNSNTKEAIFTAVTVFEFERAYRIEVDNTDPSLDGVQGVRDLAGNYLRANQTDGTTQFFVLVTDGTNDPPENTVPVDQVLPEDTLFTFSAFNGTAITVSDPDVHLGNNELEVTLTATDGLLTLGGVLGLAFTVGDGTDDLTMTFSGDVADINVALEGLVFTPTAEFVGDATVTIATADQGQFSGPPSGNEVDTDVITLTYIPVNDPPVFDLPGNPPPVVIEDAGLQTVVDFADNMDAGAPNESGQVLTFVLTMTSSTGNIAFTSGPSIDAITGDLTYETAPHTNGTATFDVVLQDDGANGGNDDNTSDTLTFTLVVDPINDEPNFELLGSADPPAVDEDAGPQTIPGYITNAVPGPIEATDEAGQELTLSFQLIGTTGNLDFVSLFIDPVTGDLTYEAAPDTAGSGLVSVTIVDDGLAAPAPNDNEGPTKQFFIVVNSVDDDPVAVTPDYVIDHGDTLLLDATDSFDVDMPLGDSITYSWDLDNDGTFGDAVGATPSVSWASLLGFGFTVPGDHTIQLQVTDSTARTNVSQATVTVVAVDYGDAPNSYGTSKPDAAAHVILPGFHLGSTVDSDIDGQNSGNLRGDDNDGTDDEDGITFHTTIEADLTQALSSPFTVDVTALFAAKLDAWVDFNDDGVFDASEHTNGGISYDVFNGSQILPMTVPAGSSLGTLAARFRLSTAGGLNPTGRADVGEVEDHEIEIIQVQAPVTPVFSSPGAKTTDRTPTFEWSADAANTSYQFQLFDADGNLIEDRENLGGNSFTIADDLPLGSYTYRVRSFNRAGTASPWSAVGMLDVAPVAPTYESPLGRVQDPTPTFAWTAVVGVEGYELRLDNLSTGQNNVLNETLSATFLTSPTELPLGDYRVRVRAFGGGVFGAFSSTEIAITTPPDVTSPDRLTFDEMPTIEWTPPAGAETFQVRVRVDGQSTNLVNVSGITGTSYTLTEPLEFGTYKVLVRATATGDPAFKSDNDVETFRLVLRPEMTAPGNRTVNPTPTAKWTAVRGGESYEFRAHNLTTGENNVVRETGIEGLSYKLPHLPIGRYAFSVRSVNPFGEFSLWSKAKIVRIVTRPVTVAPTGSFFDKQPLFTWNPLDGAKNYEIRVHRLLSGNDPDSPDGKVNNYIRQVLGDGLTTYGSPYETSSGLRVNLPNAGYRWYVRALTSDGLATNWSTPLEFKVGGQPTLDELGTTGDNTPTFRWTDIPDAVRYIFRIRRVSDNKVVLSENQLVENTFTPSDDLPNGEYRAWVRAVSADGVRSKWSPTMEFTLTSNSGDAFEPGQELLAFDDSTLTTGTFENRVEMPQVAEPLLGVSDPDIEVIDQHEISPIEHLAPRESEVEWMVPVDEVDEILTAEPSLEWLNDVSAEDLIEQAEGADVQPPEIVGGVLGGLLGATLLTRRSNKKSRDRKSL